MDQDASETEDRIEESYLDEGEAPEAESEVEAEVDGDLEADVEPDVDNEDAFEEAQANDPAARVAEYIRSESKAERLVDPAVFTEEPFSLTENELTQVWVQFASDEKYVDIVRTADERTGVEYLHAEYILSVAFAKLLLRKQANDPKYMIAEVVRENSELWPRPVAASFFSDTELFEMSPAEVTDTIAQIMADPAYADIKSVITSNGAVYLYSDRFMVEPIALRKAEWVEVESHDMYNQ